MYAATLFPSIAGGDSSELVAAAATGGVPHPPGYPLYVLITAPFTLLPFGTVAWRGNLAAAVCAAIAAALIAWATERATGRWWSGVAAAGAFAFSPIAWLYATSAEVFALNNLLLALQLCLFVANDREPRARLVYAGAFVAGLGASNHHTSVVFNLVLLAGMLWRTRAAWRSPRQLAALAACMAAGLLPYVYLPIAASRHPIIQWGDPATLQGFVTHLLRRDYGTFQLGSGPAATPVPLPDGLGAYASDLAHQISWIGIALAAWGLGCAVRDRRTRALAVTTFAAYAAFLIAFHSLANLPLHDPLLHGVVARFWLAPNLFVCFWTGLGLAAIPFVPVRALAAIGCLAAAAQAGAHARGANHRGDYVMRDYGAAVLAAAPPNALILTRGDLITNTSRYVHTIERVRPDVGVVDQEMLTFRWMAPQLQRHAPDIAVPGTHYTVSDAGGYVLKQLVDANIARRPVIVCGAPKPGDDSVARAYRLLPLGFCDRLVPLSHAIDIEAWAAENDAAMPAFRNDMRPEPPAGSWEHVAWSDYWEARHRRALTFLTMAMERQDDPPLLRRAAAEFDRVLAAHPRPPALYYKNLGITRARLAPRDPASAPLAIAALRTYLERGGGTDPQAPAIAQVIRELEGKR